jgi:hypothetical protein
LEKRKSRLLKPNLPFRSAMPAEVDFTLPLPGLSPVCGKPIIARCAGLWQADHRPL